MAKRGRPTNTNRVIKQLTNPSSVQKRTAIATDMFLPNHSGDHSAGHTKTPVDDLDISNKKYVDDAIGAIPSAIDWTISQAPTIIHADNYLDTNTQLSEGDITGMGFTKDVEVNWAISQAPAVIHADNYTDTNTTYTASDFAHNSLTGLNDGTSYEHLTATQVSALHGVNDANSTYTNLVNDSMADTLHRHSELSASDGTPNPALSVDTAGNVGIGTSTPSAKLDVTGQIEANSTLTLGKDAGNRGLVLSSSNLVISAAFNGSADMNFGYNHAGTGGMDDFIFYNNQTLIARLNNDGTFIQTGEHGGSKECLSFNRATTSGVLTATQTFWLQVGDVLMTDSKGYTMKRAGSITGVSAGFDVVTSTDAPLVTIRVKKNGTVVFYAQATLGVGDNQEIHDIQARGTDNFVAGDIISIDVLHSGAQSTLEIDNLIGMVEFYYNT